MNEREYMRLRRGLHEDYKKKLEALDLVWTMSNPACLPPKVKKKRPEIKAPGVASNSRSRLPAIVAEAVAVMPVQFSTKDVDRWIVANHGANVAERSSISHALKRLRSVKLIEAGRGKRASTYQKLIADSTVDAEPTSADIRQMSSEAQHLQIRTLAKEKALDVNKFREEVLLAKYNVNRLVELSFQEAQEVIDLLCNI